MIPPSCSKCQKLIVLKWPEDDEHCRCWPKVITSTDSCTVTVTAFFVAAPDGERVEVPQAFQDAFTDEELQP